MSGLLRPGLPRDLAIALGLLLGLLAWDASGLDLAAARLFGGPAGFAWRDHWLVSQLLHEGGRWLALGVLALIAVHLLHPLWPGMGRGERAWWLAVTLACALLVPALKMASRTSCPWELAEFGGVAQYVSHWRLGVGDGGPGRCFPSGHATSAFALLSGWFVLRGPHPRLARWWLGGVLLLGLAFGTAQLVRGAHYPSHTLWTGWLCWTLCAVAARWLPPPVPRPAAQLASL